MEASQTLRLAIPDRQCRAIAERMHVSPDYVRRWRRKLLSDEAPLGTGMASPLSRCCELVDSVFLSYPPGSSLIVEHINVHYELLTRAHGMLDFKNNPAERAEASADLLAQSVAAVNSLNLDGISEETLVKLVALRDASQHVLDQVGKALYFRPNLNHNSNGKEKDSCIQTS